MLQQTLEETNRHLKNYMRRTNRLNERYFRELTKLNVHFSELNNVPRPP